MTPRSLPTLSRRALGLLLAATAAVFVAAATVRADDRPGEVERLDAGTRRALALRLVLPETPLRYRDVRLPEHFDARTLRRLDTTPRDNALSDAGATLGRALFHDPLLSRSGTISCSTCHDRTRAFADGRTRSKGDKGRRGARNAMSLVNLRYHPTGRYFWDERAASLEEQVLMPIRDEAEMALPLDRIPARVALRKDYGPLFTAAFGDPEITTARVARALAQFVRTIVSYRSRYDMGVAFAASATEPFANFTELENEGKALFFSGGRGGNCAACHTVGGGGRGRGAGRTALFTGEFASNNGLDEADAEDRGVAGVTGRDDDAGVFKAPSLRNVELTAPYMHDGRLASLEDVVEHYSRKVRPHPNLDGRLRGRRGDGPRQLRLTSRQKQALVAFLKTLTDPSLAKDERFANPFE